MSDGVIGTEVDGYRIQTVLGRGGMGTVYKAEDVNLSRTVAIKRINPGQAERDSFIHRFRSEAQALARIDSPHIVGVYALRETDIGLLIVMEYVRGGTLKDPVEEHGAISPEQAVPILEQIMQAFHDAHSAGVIHRDIKPENVMLTQDGMVKVTDFGIAKLRQPDSGETVTQGGQGGTLKYMSPEQISNISAVDARSDLYSIGMTAYELLAGDLPFAETDTDFDIMRRVVEGEIPPPDELNPEIPSGLAQWVMGAIQKQQGDRYQSAEEMLNALRAADDQVDQTKTQPEWELGDGGSDGDETQTVAPGDVDPDQTQTVVSDENTGDEEADPVGETVLEGATDGGPSSAPQPSVSGSKAERVEPEDEPEEVEADSNWTLRHVGLAVVGLVLVVGGALAYWQMGGASEASAALSLTTEPTGALVLVNGDTAGTTPIQEYALEAGAVQLQVQGRSGSEWDTSFAANDGSRVTLNNVSLTASGAGTTVAENTGRSSGNADGPDRSAAEDPVPRTSDSGSSAQDSPNQGENTESTVSASGDTESGETASESGILEVTPQPSGTVLVDGEEQSGGHVSLPTGTHTVRCRHPEHGSIDTTITVVEGQTDVLTCYFEQDVTVNTDGVYGQIWLNGSVTDKSTPSTITLGPGSYRIEVRRKTLDTFHVEGGNVKTERGEGEETSTFAGSTYRVRVEPTFEKVERAVVFSVSRE